MHRKTKNPAVPSDAQANEKLALYVYEYLQHVGASQAAQTFLSEIRWEKNIQISTPPGFLHSWWSVFWDLYSAAPERRDEHGHSSVEAREFHDNGFMAGGDVKNMFSSFMGAPVPGGHPSGPRPDDFVRMPQGFSGPPRQPMMMPNSNTMNPRMNQSRGPGDMGPMSGPYGPRMRGPSINSSMDPGGSMPPMNMPGGPMQWRPNTYAPMKYNASMHGNYGGHPGNENIPLEPGAMTSPSASGTNVSTLIKHERNEYPMDDGPDGGRMGSLLGDSGPGTPRDDGSGGIADFNMGNLFLGGQNENDPTQSAAAILKIKERMQEEGKRFEKNPDNPDYFM